MCADSTGKRRRQLRTGARTSLESFTVRFGEGQPKLDYGATRKATSRLVIIVPGCRTDVCTSGTNRLTKWGTARYRPLHALALGDLHPPVARPRGDHTGADDCYSTFLRARERTYLADAPSLIKRLSSRISASSDSLPLRVSRRMMRARSE
jgi:hypothetical protein